MNEIFGTLKFLLPVNFLSANLGMYTMDLPPLALESYTNRTIDFPSIIHVEGNVRAEENLSKCDRYTCTLKFKVKSTNHI